MGRGGVAGAGRIFFGVAALGCTFGWGTVGLWGGLDVLSAARVVLLGVRFAGRRWAVVGWG